MTANDTKWCLNNEWKYMLRTKTTRFETGKCLIGENW